MGGGAKRKRADARSGGDDRGKDNRKKRAWRAGDAQFSGHGVFMTCVRGKERQAAAEFIDILRETAKSSYPDLDLDALPAPVKRHAESTDTPGEEDMDQLANSTGPSTEPEKPAEEEPKAVRSAADDIEAELKAELANLKSDSSKKQRGKPGGGEGSSAPRSHPAFRFMETGTECLTFISVHPALDPFVLCYAYLTDVERTGQARSRIIHRLSPVAGFEQASVTGLGNLCHRFYPRFFPADGQGTFKIDPRIRSHNTLKRDDVIEKIAADIPAWHAAEGDQTNSRGTGYRADLKNPTHWVIVEVHKSQAALSVIQDYQRFCKWNALELANSIKMKREGMADPTKDSDDRENSSKRGCISGQKKK
ncbi:unnamed protein product [Jaminaea pallidilutea]